MTRNLNYMDLTANIATFSIFALLFIRTGEKYFNLVWVVFAVFVLIDLVYCWKHKKSYLPHANVNKIIIISVILFYGALFIASLLNGAKGSIGYTVSLAKFTIPMWMLLYINGKYNATKGALVGTIFGSIVVSGVCVYQYLYIKPGMRVIGLFQQPNLMGTVLETIIPILLYCLLTIKDKLWLSADILSLGAACVALFMTGSRGAMMGLSGGLLIAVVLLLIKYRKSLGMQFMKKTVILIAILMIVPGTLGTYMFVTRPIYKNSSSVIVNNSTNNTNEDANNRPNTKKGDGKTINQSDMERIRMIQASYRMWQDHKLSGIGMASWKESYYGKYHPVDANPGTDFGMPHNMIMNFLACGGIIGLLGYLVFVFGVGIGIVKAGSGQLFFITAAVLSIHIAMFMHGMVDQTIISRFCSYPYYGFLGLFLTITGKTRRFENKE